MSGGQPAKIAKYLLKGYCLLNEYCPNGHNVPLVRSREGDLVCCCDDPTCKYQEGGPKAAECKPAAPEKSAVAAGYPAPGGAAEAVSSPPLAARVERQSAVEPQRVSSSVSGTRAVAGGAGGGGGMELVLQGADLQFCCTRLALPRPGGGGDDAAARPRLLGTSYAVRVRLGVEGAVDTRTLREAVLAECAQLGDKVLLPAPAGGGEGGLQVTRAAGQVVVTCDGGARFEFPDRDCASLPVAGIVVEELAVLLLERLGGLPCCARSAGMHWVEVSLTQAPGAEAIARRDCA